jgi:hypothetical protein
MSHCTFLGLLGEPYNWGMALLMVITKLTYLWHYSVCDDINKWVCYIYMNVCFKAEATAARSVVVNLNGAVLLGFAAG